MRKPPFRYNRGTLTLRSLGAALLLVAAMLLTSPAPIAQSETPADVCAIQTTERIVAIGDVHGAYDQFVAILRTAGLIDNRQRWTGGRAIFVQTGDVTDRGPASRQVIDLLRRLETEAPRAGGRVIPLLGNHEAMRLEGERRYISDAEYNAFKGPDSNGLRDRAFEFMVGENAKRAKAAGIPFDSREFRKTFYDSNPLGAIEMQIAFSPDGDYGRWVRERNTVARINGIVFLHGGLSPDVAALGCAGINTAVKAELKGPMPPPDRAKALITSPDGPLWYRGLVDDGAAPGPADAAKIETAVKAMDARAIVLGHTVTPKFLIKSASNGRIVQIDTGMLGGDYYPGGRASALEITGDTWTAIYQDGRQPISKGPSPRPAPARAR